MEATERRNVVIGLAARFPGLREAAVAGWKSSELRRRFPLLLEESDVDLLRSVTTEEVATVRYVLEEQFAELYPFGI